MSPRLGTWLVALFLALAPVRAAAQAIDPGILYRVFLKDGRALPSYGEYTQVDGRLVFLLPVGDPAKSVEFQLMSLPLASLDMARTTRYTEATRARRYAETRGPADYSAISGAVTLALAEVENERDVKVRLRKAEEARANLIAWPNQHFGYRSAEIRDLASLFDEVISELRTAAGQPRMSASLVAGPVLATYDPPLPVLNLNDSISLAVAAAEVSDIGEDRTAILRAALSAAGENDSAEIRSEISRRLVLELNADAAYAHLQTELMLRADAAMHRGDVKTVSELADSLPERDRLLGRLRPFQVQMLSDRLRTMLDQTRAYRLVLDHWAISAKAYAAYELRIRPITSGVDGLRPVLAFIQDMRGMAFSRLVGANARLQFLADQLQRIQPPADLQTVHSTLVSAVFMARQATDRRRQAVITSNLSVARDASSAAAGAVMLFDQARANLLSQMAVPRFK